MKRGRLVTVPQEAVLGGESRCFRVVEAGLGKPELGFFVVDVAGESEAVPGGRQLAREAVVSPGVQVIAGRGRPAVVGEVDDGSQPIEGEVLPGFVCSGEADEAIGSDCPIQSPFPADDTTTPRGVAGSTLSLERFPAFGGLRDSTASSGPQGPFLARVRALQDGPQVAHLDLRVAGRSAEAAVAEQHLDVTHVGAAAEEMGRARMP